MAELLYPYVGHKPDDEVIQWARDLLADDNDTEALTELDSLPEDEALDFAKELLMHAGAATFVKEDIEP